MYLTTRKRVLSPPVPLKHPFDKDNPLPISFEFYHYTDLKKIKTIFIGICTPGGDTEDLIIRPKESSCHLRNWSPETNQRAMLFLNKGLWVLKE